MPGQLAFLTYKRKDDESSNGYISSFRKTLENAVHVVTGEETFQVFQDVEGVVIGENWEKKLADVIQKSSFLLPMMTPLFFNSKECRGEVEEFLAHERDLGRDDLILPVYFFPCPKIEKEEEKAKDPLVKELVKRQMFDWRKMAFVELTKPKARKAMLKLAAEIGKAIERLKESGIEPAGGNGRSRLKDGFEIMADDPRLGAGVTGTLKREVLTVRTILWVDDSPDNNVHERDALKHYGACFVLARDTAEAQQLLFEKGPFSAIISDMGRPGDREAGYTLLERVRNAGIKTPYFIYTTPSAAKRSAKAQARGAQGLTADPDVLVEMVVGTFD